MTRMILTLPIALFVLALFMPLKADAEVGGSGPLFVQLADLTPTADCSAEGTPEDYKWSSSWTDAVAQPGGGTRVETTYTVEGPCKVYKDDTFEIKMTATDPYCSTGWGWHMVALEWSLVNDPNGETPIVEASGNSFATAIDVGSSGTWTQTEVLSADYGVDHTITFNAKDLGHCFGAHAYTSGAAGGVVVDPIRGGAENTAPTADAGADLEVLDVDLAGTTVYGSVSDLEGDDLVYTWSEGSVTLAGPASSFDGSAPLSLPALSLGDHTLTLTVTDGELSASDSVVVTVADGTPPELSPSANIGILWPPNKKMNEIVISAHATDNSGGPITLSATITDSEGKGGYTVDSIDSEAGTVIVSLLAKRGGKKSDGRVYTITVTATDEAGNAASADVLVSVPHDRKHYKKKHKKKHKK